MIKSLRIFDGSQDNDDEAYKAYVRANPDDVVANIPRLPFDYMPIKLHCHASCPYTLSYGSGKSLTAKTQWKICSPSQDLVEEIVRHYTQKPLEYCQSLGSCGRFWDRQGHRSGA
jgi:hypothetical protein